MWIEIDDDQYLNLHKVENICKGGNTSYTDPYSIHYSYDKNEDSDLVQRFTTEKERDAFFEKIGKLLIKKQPVELF